MAPAWRLLVALAAISGCWAREETCVPPAGGEEVSSLLQAHGARAALPSGPSARSTLYAFGDTHGGNNMLIRNLLATEKFSLNQERLPVWRDELDAEGDWVIVVHGDQVNKGDLSKSNLLLLKGLTEDAVWGERLIVLKGNHEHEILRLDDKYIDNEKAPNDNWTPNDKVTGVLAREGNESALITWILERPVAYFGQGVFAVHGGLQRTIAERVVKEPDTRGLCKEPGPPCGQAVAAYINGHSHRYYERMRACMQGHSTREDAQTGCDTTPPYFLADEDKTCGANTTSFGVVNYRGYGANSCLFDAGGNTSCREASDVGGVLGAEVMTMGHVSHRWIRSLCAGGGHKTRVFNLDTSWQDCQNQAPGECTFEPEHTFHGETSAQVLRIERRRDGSRSFHNCTAVVEENYTYTIECTDF